MRVKFTKDAAEDLSHIRSHIIGHDSAAAARIMMQIRSLIRILEEYPYLGHRGIRDGTYEKTASRTPYVVVYQIDRDELIVLRVLRSSQDRSHLPYH